MTPLEKARELGFPDLESYQSFFGLMPSGEADGPTVRSLEIPRVCGLPDNMELGEGLPRWGKKILSYALGGELPGITLEDTKRAFQTAWDRWSAVCDIKASYIKSAGQAADVVIATGTIDGASSTLAWSELPGNGTIRQLKQKYDSAEPWVIADNAANYRIDLVRVACHEIGHVIGLAHLGPGNLLAPTYSSSINKPQDGDIFEAQKRYGPPVVQPPPSGPDASQWIMIRLPKEYLVTQ
jgi:hypothetical protein